MVFIKKNIGLIIFILLVAFTSYAFGRAGGGGGHGGGGGGGGSYGRGNGGGLNPLFIIVAVCWAAYTVFLTILLFIKTGLSNSLINKISKKDPMWHLATLHNNSQTVFLKMQEAWQARSMNSVKKEISQELYSRYTLMLNEMIKNNEKNIISDITITEIRIISCQDFNDNSKDTYIAHIEGELLDYTINTRTKSVIKNEDQTTEGFKDAYYFRRSGNKWILDNIINDPGLLTVSVAKNYVET